MIGPLLLAVDFMNFAYPKTPCERVRTPAVVSRGSLSYSDTKYGVGYDIRVNRVARGSLAAGTRQAAVVLTCEPPRGSDTRVYLFEERGTRAVLLGEIGGADSGGDWGRGPDDIKIRFTGQTVHVTACASYNCSTTADTVYALRGGKLVKITKRSQKT